MFNRLLTLSLLCVLSTSVFVACSSSDNNNSNNSNNNSGGLATGPDWYMNHEGEDESRIYGYGISAGEQNLALAEASAKTSAREDVASTMNTLIQAMLERYLNSVSDGDSIREEMNSTQTLRGITDQAISGFQIKKKQAQGKYLFVRGYVAIDKLKEIIRNSRDIKEALKEVKENSEEAFNKMDRMLDEVARENR